jgi:hypothetical protein
MGIDLRIETERGECVAELGDPCNRVNWLLSLGTTDSTFCLQFIDRYGNTVFNSLQLPVLQSEFTSLRSRLTEVNLLEAKRVYLDHAAPWPKTALDEARKNMAGLSLNDLRDHLEEVLRLLSDMKIPHYYARFIGD